MSIRPHLAPLLDGTYAEDVRSRLMAGVSVDPASHCWEWLRYRTPDGYGRISVKRRMIATHQVSFMLLRGPWPSDLQLDHLCRNRGCCNPDHLEPVTLAENVRRGAAVRDRVTHCPKGHPLDDGYVAQDRSTPTCRSCHRDANRAYARRKRAAAPPKPPSPKKPSRAAHGTRSRYVLGCRCDQCSAADSAYKRDYRTRRAAS